MSTIVLLDAGPLGLVTNPRATPENLECNKWLEALLLNGFQVYVPEIADYEVRRELLRANKLQGVRRLDELKNAIGYIPLNTEMMLKAAEFWAQVRQQGQPTADDKALDGDVILAAQADILGNDGVVSVIIATTNVGHLSRLVPASTWRDIRVSGE
jgi:predicted nucleic acid-binding protein